MKLVMFEVETPKGVMKVQAPENATDDEIIARVKRMRFSNEPPAASDPTKGGTLSPLGMDTGIPLPAGADRFLSGVGQQFTDYGLGTKQLVPGIVASEDV